MTTEPNEGRFRDQVLRTASAKAAESQGDFTAYMEKSALDAMMVLRLITICGGKLAESIVLWDVLEHVAKRGLHAYKEAAASDYVSTYGSGICSERAYRQAVTDLIAEGFLHEVPRTRTQAKHVFLNWPVLAEALANDVDMKFPALRPSNAK